MSGVITAILRPAFQDLRTGIIITRLQRFALSVATFWSTLHRNSKDESTVSLRLFRHLNDVSFYVLLVLTRIFVLVVVISCHRGTTIPRCFTPLTST